MTIPLAERIRPQTLDQVVGHHHLLGKGKILSTIVASGQLPNMIFYGPSGVGKTTVARIIATQTNRLLYQLNGTSTNLADLKQIISQKDTLQALNGILLYLDEIQYLNKKQQQCLLAYLEDGSITLIASTTENPYFYIYHAILSRCTVFEFECISTQDMTQALQRSIPLLEQQYCIQIDLHPDTLSFIAQRAHGDVRQALNCLELAVLSAPLQSGSRKSLSIQQVQSLNHTSSMPYHQDGDSHYDLLSALQKSIRGSDSQAAVHYLACLLEVGELITSCRRLLVIACEDIGLAYPNAITIVKACVDAALQLGLPEARIPLAQAVIFLATSPKSNTAYQAISLALSDLKQGKGGRIPLHLQQNHCHGASSFPPHTQPYLFPHDYEHHYVKQQYLPDDLVDVCYYHYGNNKREQLTKQYWDRIKQTD